MGLWLDCGEEILPRKRCIEDDPLTAIARAYSPSGFTVAADSRKLNSDNTFTNDSRKIFGFSHKSARVICSIAGLVQWTNFELDLELTKIAKRIESIALRNPNEYADAISSELLVAISNIGYPKDSKNNNARADTWIYLDGYVLNKPVRYRIKVIHGDDASKMEVLEQGLSDFCCHGSTVVYNGLFSITPMGDFLSAYRKNLGEIGSDGLKASIARSEIFIKAHGDPEALARDQICAGVGGPIHIATLTPEAGFQWVPGYEPVR